MIYVNGKILTNQNNNTNVLISLSKKNNDQQRTLSHPNTKKPSFKEWKIKLKLKPKKVKIKFAQNLKIFIDSGKLDIEDNEGYQV